MGCQDCYAIKKLNDSLKKELTRLRAENAKLKAELAEVIALGRDCYTAVQGWRPEDFEEGGFDISRAIESIKTEVTISRENHQQLVKARVELAKAKDVPIEISDLSSRLKADLEHNDHYTAEPMFCLQILVRDAGFDSEYGDAYCWFSFEETEWLFDDDENLPDDIEDREGWYRFGYKDRWETVMVAFTKDGLYDYMRLDGHNVKRRAFRGETRIYVESFRRCNEMTALRKYLVTAGS